MIRTVDALDFTGKRVFARVDFNVPIKNGVISDDTRIREALPTLRKILSSGGSLILASHLGRPKGFDPSASLAPVAARLAELLGTEVALAAEVVGECVSDLADALEPGGVMMLENVRFETGETKNDPALSKAFAKLADLYVNDAFGSCHRAHSSTAGIADYFPPERKAAGYLLTREVESFRRVLENPARPFVAVLGGAKVSDKIAVIENLIPRVQKLIIGGAMAFTFLKSAGVEVGGSLVEEDKLDLARELTAKAARTGVALLLPVDHVVASEMTEEAPTQVTATQAVPVGLKGFDIGPKSIELFSAALADAGTVVWNGPMGVFEVKQFSKGTFELARAVAACPGFTVVGGGDSVSAVKKAGVADRIGHVSTGGGASLELLEGKVLPGIAALDG